MNPELARHDAAKQRITKEMKRKRDEEGAGDD
jgi:ATP-dependent RNA helicase DDX23/PRP28